MLLPCELAQYCRVLMFEKPQKKQLAASGRNRVKSLFVFAKTSFRGRASKLGRAVRAIYSKFKYTVNHSAY